MDVVSKLSSAGIRPSRQRVAVARFVLSTTSHPSADEVMTAVQGDLPDVSRATIYNTLNLFVERGLLRALSITEGRVLFDPRVEAHHHFIDEETGEIHDVPWEALTVSGTEELEGFDVRDHEVVLRGRRRS